MAECTEDFGKTYRLIFLYAKNTAEAYARFALELSKDGAITKLSEVV